MSDHDEDEEVKYEVLNTRCSTRLTSNVQVVFEGDAKKYSWIAKDGKALAKFPNGDTYEGEYRGGKRNGWGKCALKPLWSGCTTRLRCRCVQSRWFVHRQLGERTVARGWVHAFALQVNNKKEGKGTMVNPDGGQYEGAALALQM